MSLRFQNTILGHLFGVRIFLRSQRIDADIYLTLGKHMNADHVSRLL